MSKHYELITAQGDRHIIWARDIVNAADFAHRYYDVATIAEVDQPYGDDIFAELLDPIDPEIEAKRHRAVIHVSSDQMISETNPNENAILVHYSRDMTQGYHSVWAVPGTL